MVSLELLIDARGMETGAAQATRALDSVSAKATQAERSISQTGRGLNAAFQATTGLASVGTNIATAANQFERLNLAAAGFSAARGLQNIGQVSQDMAVMGGHIGSVGLAFARLNPYILAASVALSLVSIGMTLFGDKTDDATESVKRQATALDNLKAKLNEVQIRASYGAGDPRQTIGGTIDTLTALRLEPSSKIRLDPKNAAALFGVSEQEFRAAAGRGGLGESAVEGSEGRIRLPSDGIFGRPTGPLNGRFEYSKTSFTRDEVLGAGETLLKDRRISETSSRDDIESRLRQERDIAKIQQATEEQRQRTEEERRAAFQEMEESARRTGEYFGDGVADLVLGLRSAKEIAASIGQDFVRQGIRQATGNLFASFTQSFGATAAQKPGGVVTPTVTSYNA